MKKHIAPRTLGPVTRRAFLFECCGGRVFAGAGDAARPCAWRRQSLPRFIADFAAALSCKIPLVRGFIVNVA